MNWPGADAREASSIRLLSSFRIRGSAASKPTTSTDISETNLNKAFKALFHFHCHESVGNSNASSKIERVPTHHVFGQPGLVDVQPLESVLPGENHRGNAAAAGLCALLLLALPLLVTGDGC